MLCTFVSGFYKHQTVSEVLMAFICLLYGTACYQLVAFFVYPPYGSVNPQVAKTLEILTALPYGSGSSTASVWTLGGLHFHMEDE